MFFVFVLIFHSSHAYMYVYWDPIFLHQQLASISWYLDVILSIAFGCFNFSDWIFVTIFRFSHTYIKCELYIGALEQMTCIEYYTTILFNMVCWTPNTCDGFIVLSAIAFWCAKLKRWRKNEGKGKRKITIIRTTMLLQHINQELTSFRFNDELKDEHLNSIREILSKSMQTGFLDV